MSVGYITRRIGLSFKCRTGGLLRPEIDYCASDGRVGDFGQKRDSAPKARG
jgi:hypothetical protein